MQLFTRRLLLVGPPDESVAWASDICAAASAGMGTQVSLWSVGFGGPIGAVGFTARVEGIADLMAKAGPMLADPAYQAKLAKGRDLVGGPPEDSLATPIHGELGDPPPVGSFAAVTNATIANGKYAEAIGWGIEVSDHVTELTGMPVALLMQEYGPMGVLTWIGLGADGAAVDASGAAMAADADYIAMLSAAGDLFVEGSAHRSLVTRLA